GQVQQRPIAARDDVAALLLFDGGEGEVEVAQREQLKARRCRGALARGARVAGGRDDVARLRGDDDLGDPFDLGGLVGARYRDDAARLGKGITLDHGCEALRLHFLWIDRL